MRWSSLSVLVIPLIGVGSMLSITADGGAGSCHAQCNACARTQSANGAAQCQVQVFWDEADGRSGCCLDEQMTPPCPDFTLTLELVASTILAASVAPSFSEDCPATGPYAVNGTESDAPVIFDGGSTITTNGTGCDGCTFNVRIVRRVLAWREHFSKRSCGAWLRTCRAW